MTEKGRKKSHGRTIVKGPRCPILETDIPHLGTYFDVCNSLLRKDASFWFRGHGDVNWTLTPSALRYGSENERNRALSLLRDFKRYGEIKITNAPGANEELNWVQLARHYGLPTRLLDWTKNAAIALYFACLPPPKGNAADGAVFILNPVDLNREADRKTPRVFDAHSDASRIERYFRLTGRKTANGSKIIAIDPIWNSDRIMLQQGVFTLHGSRDFTLTSQQASSLVAIRIRCKNKQSLLQELERVGINEMAIFPEPEHTCNYLKWREKLVEDS